MLVQNPLDSLGESRSAIISLVGQRNFAYRYVVSINLRELGGEFIVFPKARRSFAQAEQLEIKDALELSIDLPQLVPARRLFVLLAHFRIRLTLFPLYDRTATRRYRAAGCF